MSGGASVAAITLKAFNRMVKTLPYANSPFNPENAHGCSLSRLWPDVFTECPRHYHLMLLKLTIRMLMLAPCCARSARIQLQLHQREGCELDSSAERQKLPHCSDLICNQALHQHEYRMTVSNLCCLVDSLMMIMVSMRNGHRMLASGSPQPPTM